MPSSLRIFIIGAGGQVGGKLAESASEQGFEVFGGHMSRPWADGQRQSVAFNKADRDSVAKALSETEPEVVVDTGALHNVDYCETHPEEAMAVNAIGTRNVAEECARNGSRLVYVSTDFVFDGNGAPYSEGSVPNPLSVYARSKLEGERHALSHTSNIVVRPSVIYSWVPESRRGQGSASGKPLNFAAWLVSQLTAGKQVSIVNDQVASPTLADDLARAVLAIVKSGKSGLFHTAGATPLSRYDFSVKLAERLGLDAALIRPIQSSGLKQAAKRPRDSSLLSERIGKEVGYRMLGIESALDEFAGQAGVESQH